MERGNTLQPIDNLPPKLTLIQFFHSVWRSWIKKCTTWIQLMRRLLAKTTIWKMIHPNNYLFQVHRRLMTRNTFNFSTASLDGNPTVSITLKETSNSNKYQNQRHINHVGIKKNLLLISTMKNTIIPTEFQWYVWQRYWT